MTTYKGRFIPLHPKKYKGDPTGIVYRSLWERQLFRWLDSQTFVESWSSEETVVPYRCKTDNKLHRYFVDVKMTFTDGRTFLIEVKPAKETEPPKSKGRQGKRFITEVLTYAKNISKWEAAQSYAADRGWIFEIWTEDTLRKLGIKII